MFVKVNIDIFRPKNILSIQCCTTVLMCWSSSLFDNGEVSNLLSSICILCRGRGGGYQRAGEI